MANNFPLRYYLYGLYYPLIGQFDEPLPSCQISSTQYCRDKHVQSHGKKEEGRGMHICMECAFSFYNESALAYHQKSTHNRYIERHIHWVLIARISIFLLFKESLS